MALKAAVITSVRIEFSCLVIMLTMLLRVFSIYIFNVSEPLKRCNIV